MHRRRACFDDTGPGKWFYITRYMRAIHSSILVLVLHSAVRALYFIANLSLSNARNVRSMLSSSTPTRRALVMTLTPSSLNHSSMSRSCFLRPLLLPTFAPLVATTLFPVSSIYLSFSNKSVANSYCKCCGCELVEHVNLCADGVGEV
jgi:hypothetical protein